MSDTTAPATRGRANSTSKGQKKEQRKKPQKKMDDVVTCNNCHGLFADATDKLLQCERCNMWNCIACLKYSDAEYDLLNARPGPAVIKLLQNSTPNKSQTPKYMLHSSRAENRRL